MTEMSDTVNDVLNYYLVYFCLIGLKQMVLCFIQNFTDVMI